MELKLPLEGSSTILSFFPDDTIETVRQVVALAKQTHPDRLFIQIEVELPKDYYSSNPKRWMDLFYRLSHGTDRVTAKVLDAYLTHVRPGTNVTARDISRSDWQSVDDSVALLFSPPDAFKEWRILGVPEEKSVVLPVPPVDTLIPAAYRPIPARQLLFETVHREEAHTLSALEVDPDTSDTIKEVYFPFFQSSTPANIETLRAPLKATHDRIISLMDLPSPPPSRVSILRTKWYIPLISTKFTAPRVRFEQIFYGLTVSPATPVVSYFTSRGETTRHKFYVENPKSKEPLLDIPMWKAWTSGTQPQRRLPTLLLYRGKSRSSFDRIAITNKDIVVSTWRGKDSKETLEELQESMLEWLQSLDAVMPFIVDTDIGLSRWTLNDLSVVASYAKEISEFDMRRFSCLQTIFSHQDNAFRLLRADRETDVPAEVLRAYTILQADGSLETEMGVSSAEAAELKEKVTALEEDENFNFEKATGSYPVISFSSKDVIVKFVKNVGRVIEYASMLRYVLTSDKPEVNALCPRRLETVEATAGVAQATIEVADDFDLEGFEEFGSDEPAEPQGSNAAAAPANLLRVKKGGPLTSHNYFNDRITQIDPELVDSDYSKTCEKLIQVVILTPEDQARIPEQYNYSGASENEKMKVDKGIAICPQYWCMRDEIPLSEGQLVTDEANVQHCPVCDGKVRITDKEDAREFTVIKRKADFKYPDYKDPSSKTSSKKKAPCCYKKPATAAASEVLGPKTATDDYYVLSAGVVPALRISYLPIDLAKRLGVKTDYLKTCPRNRIEASATDMFRVGVGLPRESLPVLLHDERPIPTPSDAKDKIIQCSFFRTWKELGDGDTLIERITNGIDKAYRDKSLPALDEIEYVSLILDCRVMRINTAKNTMLCGFWSDKTSAKSRTIALLDTDVLGKVSRRAGNVGTKFDYVIDVNKFEESTKVKLRQLHVSACATTVPSFDDAVKELMAKNISTYQVILDPFERVQAVFVPQEVVLPVQPINMEISRGVHVRSGYADVKDEELPTSKTLGEFLNDTRHTGFKRTEVLYSADGSYSEFLLESGFRALFRPEEAEDEDIVKEVMQTVREHTEEALVHAKPNRQDLKLASDITYSSEVFEFLMFSLSKDIQDADHEDLRRSIAKPTESLYKDLAMWLDHQAYWDEVNEPVQFVNKVRTPCGQMEKDTCKKSTLCGWHENKCKIKVKSIVDKRQVLTRMTKVIKDNSKQRALLLDGRLSPFFSTILYLEMPHELITNDV